MKRVGEDPFDPVPGRDDGDSVLGVVDELLSELLDFVGHCFGGDSKTRGNPTGPLEKLSAIYMICRCKGEGGQRIRIRMYVCTGERSGIAESGNVVFRTVV